MVGLLSLVGCQRAEPLPTPNAPSEEVVFRKGFYRPPAETLSSEIIEWMEYSKEVPLVQERIYDGKRYVLITEGEKPSGGYGVEVQEVISADGNLEVKVKITEPQKDQQVTDDITYPYDLIVVEEKELPLHFLDVDNPNKYFMNLLGIDVINQPIVAASTWIKVFTPAPNQDITEIINVSGIASVFEGTVSLELITPEGEIVFTHFTTAAMGDWAFFQEEITIPEKLGQTQLTLQLYSESMKDGSKMFVVEIPLVVHE